MYRQANHEQLVDSVESWMQIKKPIPGRKGSEQV